MQSKADEIRRLYKAGEQQRNIAAILNVTPQQVSSALKSVKIQEGTYKPRQARYQYSPSLTGPTYPVSSFRTPDPPWMSYLEEDADGKLKSFICWRLYILDLDDLGRPALFASREQLIKVLHPPAVHLGFSPILIKHAAPVNGCQCGYHAEVDLARLLANRHNIGLDYGGLNNRATKRTIVAACRPVGPMIAHDQGLRVSQVRLVGLAAEYPNLLPGLIQAALRLDEPVRVAESIDQLRQEFPQLGDIPCI